jgi:hypothetical protein
LLQLPVNTSESMANASEVVVDALDVEARDEILAIATGMYSEPATVHWTGEGSRFCNIKI